MKYVQESVNEINMFNFWTVDYFDLESFIKTYRRRRLFNFKQNWQRQMDNNSQCTFYSSVKQNPFKEEYLKIPDCSISRVLAKFRMGAHHLPSTRNRYDRDGPKERLLCNLCSANVLGDELHYLFNCSFFDDKRKKIIPEYTDCSAMNYFPVINNTFDIKEYDRHCFRLAAFIKCIFNQFKYDGKEKEQEQQPSTPSYNPVSVTRGGRQIKPLQILDL